MCEYQHIFKLDPSKRDELEARLKRARNQMKHLNNFLNTFTEAYAPCVQYLTSQDDSNAAALLGSVHIRVWYCGDEVARLEAKISEMESESEQAGNETPEADHGCYALEVKKA